MSYATQQITKNHGDPIWEAIWNTIKGWDIRRADEAGYHGATGDDAQAIFDAITAVR